MCWLFREFFSSPALLVLLASIPRVFAASTLAGRWLRLLVLVVGASGIAFGCAYWMLKDDSFERNLGIRLALPYLLVALPAAAIVYWPLLRRPASPQLRPETAGAG